MPEILFESEITNERLAGEVSLRIRNEAQVMLAERSGIKLTDWINENSDRFRQILKTDPDLRKLITSDLSAAVLEIENRLKKDLN